MFDRTTPEGAATVRRLTTVDFRRYDDWPLNPAVDRAEQRGHLLGLLLEFPDRLHVACRRATCLARGVVHRQSDDGFEGSVFASGECRAWFPWETESMIDRAETLGLDLSREFRGPAKGAGG